MPLNHSLQSKQSETRIGNTWAIVAPFAQDNAWTVIEYPDRQEVLVELLPATSTDAKGTARVKRTGNEVTIHIQVSGLTGDVSNHQVYLVDSLGNATMLGTLTPTNGSGSLDGTSALHKFMIVISPDANFTSIGSGTKVALRSAVPAGFSVGPREAIDSTERDLASPSSQLSITIPVNIVSAQFKADPFPFLANLRASQPVYQTTLPDKTPVWLITRYADVTALFKDERFVKNRRTAMTQEQLRKMPWVPPIFRPLERNMLDLDAPDHTRLRALVHKAFTPNLVGRMRDRVQTLADELLDRVIYDGEIDLIEDYALPLPMTIITEILGVPARDHHKFHKWSKAVVSLTSPKATLRVIPSIWMFIRYLRQFFKMRRRDPRDDLATALIQAEEAGDKLSEDELLAMVFLLLIAGHETTVNLIGNGMLALLEHPDAMNRLRREPGMIKPAVEELLRYTSPVLMSTERYAREDVNLHGITIPRGGMTLGVIGSANRDESVFRSADELDLTREPNKHLSFGQGIHFCLGAPLARLEGEIAINTLLRRMPDLRLSGATESLRWRPSMMLRGLESLPVSFGVVVR